MNEHHDSRSDAVLAALDEVGAGGQVVVHDPDCAMEWSDDHEWTVVPCSCTPQVVSRGDE